MLRIVMLSTLQCFVVLLARCQEGKSSQDLSLNNDQLRPKLVVQMGHSGCSVNSLLLSPDGKRMMTMACDGAARLWELDSGREVRAFHTNDDSATAKYSGPISFAWSADGKWLVTASQDKTARLWDISTGKQVRVFRGHSESLSSIALSADAKLLVTGSADNTIRLWELATGRQLYAIQWDRIVLVLTISHDSKWLAIAGGGNATQSYDSLFLWDLATGKVVREFKGHSSYIEAAAFSRDGSSLVSASSDNTARLWDVKTGKQVRSFVGHTAPIKSLALAGEGKWLCTASQDKTVRLWDLISGAELRSFRGHTDIVNSAAVSADSTRLATGGADGTARLWDLATGRQIRVFESKIQKAKSLVLSGDNKWMITLADEETINVWDLCRGRISNTIFKTKGKFCEAALSRNGRLLVTIEGDTAQLWDTFAGKPKQTLYGHTDNITAVSFSADARWLVTAGNDRNVKIWSMQSGEAVRSFRCERPIWNIAISADGKWLITSSESEKCLWEVSTGKKVRTSLRDIREGTHLALAPIALSSDGQWLATSEPSEAIVVSELATGRQFRKLDVAYAQFLAFSGDSKLLVSQATTWDEWCLHAFDTPRVLQLWDIATGSEVVNFKSPPSIVLRALTNDGRHLIGSGPEGAIRVWDVRGAKELCQVVCFRDGSWAAYDAEGRYDAANDGDVEGMHWVKGSETSPLRRYRDHYYDPGLLAKYLGLRQERPRIVAAAR